MKIVISEPKTGKTYQMEISKDKEAHVLGKKIGDSIDGNLIGAAGYTLELTGGSDGSGFPMSKSVHGSARKPSLLTASVGFDAAQKGQRSRKHVRGNTFSSEIVQVNTKVLQAGPTPLEQLFPKAEKEKK